MMLKRSALRWMVVGVLGVAFVLTCGAGQSQAGEKIVIKFPRFTGTSSPSSTREARRSVSI